MSGVLCDHIIVNTLQRRVHKMVAWPVLIYGSETWPIKEAHEKSLDVTQMRMLGRMMNKTRKDKQVVKKYGC